MTRLSVCGRGPAAHPRPAPPVCSPCLPRRPRPLRTTGARAHTPGGAAAHILLMALIVLSVACQSVSPKPKVDVALGRQLSAELTAAQTTHETTMQATGEEYRAQRLTDEQFSRLRSAGLMLEQTLRQFSAELRLYLATGEITPTLKDTRIGMMKAKTHLSKLWEDAHGQAQ